MRYTKVPKLTAERLRRANRFLKWAAWHVARGGRVTDEKVLARLDKMLYVWARYYTGSEKLRHYRLIVATERALMAVLEVRETLPLETEGRKKLSGASHQMTDALIREGR